MEFNVVHILKVIIIKIFLVQKQFNARTLIVKIVIFYFNVQIVKDMIKIKLQIFVKLD